MTGNAVCNEESWILISPVCIGAACCCSYCRRAAGEEGPADRVFIVVRSSYLVGGADIPQIQGLRDGLKNNGYIQGRNLDLQVSAKETYEEYRPLIESYKEK